jgi:hypothetical protein
MHGSPAGAACFDHRAAGDELVMQIRDDQVPAGTQHAGEFCQYRLEAGHMDECERADDDVHRIIGQRQLVQRSEVELAIFDAPPRAGSRRWWSPSGPARAAAGGRGTAR